MNISIFKSTLDVWIAKQAASKICWAMANDEYDVVQQLVQAIFQIQPTITTKKENIHISMTDL